MLLAVDSGSAPQLEPLACRLPTARIGLVVERVVAGAILLGVIVGAVLLGRGPDGFSAADVPFLEARARQVHETLDAEFCEISSLSYDPLFRAGCVRRLSSLQARFEHRHGQLVSAIQSDQGERADVLLGQILKILGSDHRDLFERLGLSRDGHLSGSPWSVFRACRGSRDGGK